MRAKLCFLNYGLWHTIQGLYYFYYELIYFCEMKYQTGDEIIIKLTGEDGRVLEIMNEQMVMIEVRGVKFPAYVDQLDFPYFKRFSEKKIQPEKKKEKKYVEDVPKEKPQPNQIKVADGVWLTLIPKFTLDEFNDEVVELLKIYLVNRTNYSFNFEYEQKLLGETEFAIKNEIASFHDFYLHDFAFEHINDSPNFCLDFSLTKPNKKKAPNFETLLKLKPKQVFKQIEELKKNNQSTISYKLFEEYPDKVEEEKFELSGLAAKGFKIYAANKIRQNLEPARTVIDLHIEKLTNNYQHLSSLEMLGIQLAEFEKWYHLAVAHRLPSFIVIHGIGKGTLKDEIHELLKSRKEVKTFINQYDARFGYGATEIFFGY